MVKIRDKVLWMLVGSLLLTIAHAKNKDPKDYALMTVLDLRSTDTSNISIINRTGTPVTASGLFIASFDVNDCSSCSGNVTGGDNLGGAVLSSITFKPNQSLAIGKNYLYNMLYNGIYYIKNTVGSSPCALPGCSWPGDDPNVQGWCITINVISRNSTYTYSNYTNGSNPAANTPPYGAAGNTTTFDYKYDLIDPSLLGASNACLGLITCNDKTLTCQVANAQNESFQPYA
jgi:hypothetical protein